MSDDAERVWNLMEAFPVCTVASWDGVELRSRPMATFVRRRNEALYFLADGAFYTDEAIRTYPGVSLTFADTANDQIVSVSGIAQTSADPLVIRELWATSARQQWDSPSDPNIRMLRIMPQHATIWVGAARSVRMVSLVNRPAGRPADSSPKAAL